MTVYLVGAGPGDPGLLTRRAAALLARAEVVLHDRLVSDAVLELTPPDALRIGVGIEPGQEHGPERQRQLHALLVEHGRTGRAVVRLKGGDPFVFGRGGEEAEALRAAGVAYEVVPGVTSAFAAPAYAGIPVTQRGISSAVTVVTGHRDDAADASGVDWEALARAGGTLVVLMGSGRRHDIAERLMAAGRSSDTPVAAVERGTTPRQRVVRTTLSRLADVEVNAPAAIVVGGVAELDLGWLDQRPLWGWSVVTTRTRAQAASLVAHLEDAGADVVELPVIATVDPLDGGAALSGAAAEVRRYDWVVFTSANAVQRFASRLRDARSWGDVRVAVVGPATAAALDDIGIVADLVPAEATAETLVKTMDRAPARPEAGRVLFVRAAAAREVIGDGLRAKGWNVDEVEAYRTVTAGPADGVSEARLDAAARADVVTFTSPSTVSAFLELAGSRRVAPVVACIGPVTAHAARDAGLEVSVVAEPHTAEGLVGALVEFRRAVASVAHSPHEHAGGFDDAKGASRTPG